MWWTWKYESPNFSINMFNEFHLAWTYFVWYAFMAAEDSALLRNQHEVIGQLVLLAYLQYKFFALYFIVAVNDECCCQLEYVLCTYFFFLSLRAPKRRPNDLVFSE